MEEVEAAGEKSQGVVGTPVPRQRPAALQAFKTQLLPLELMGFSTYKALSLSPRLSESAAGHTAAWELGRC